MLYFVTGGSGSGKSEYAENLAVEMHQGEFLGGALYYIATMLPWGEEGRRRILRHRRQRRDKGFLTRERFCRLELLEGTGEDVILLECISNLLANEMYMEAGGLTRWSQRVEEGEFLPGDSRLCPSLTESSLRELERDLERTVLEPVYSLAERTGCLIVVSNEIFSDGSQYDRGTELYRMLLAAVHQRLAARADCVVETVCSIPVFVKGEKLCSSR